MSWPGRRVCPPAQQASKPSCACRRMAASLLHRSGAATIGVAIAAQVHAPQPSLTAAGVLGPFGGQVARTAAALAAGIPSICPPLACTRNCCAWGSTRTARSGYRRSTPRPMRRRRTSTTATPRPDGSLGHRRPRQQGYLGAAVFYRLERSARGQHRRDACASGVTAVFRVTGVRQYVKSVYPAKIVHGTAGFPALRLITCGGAPRLRHQELPQLHLVLRVPDLYAAGGQRLRGWRLRPSMSRPTSPPLASSGGSTQSRPSRTPPERIEQALSTYGPGHGPCSRTERLDGPSSIWSRQTVILCATGRLPSRTAALRHRWMGVPL